MGSKRPDARAGANQAHDQPMIKEFLAPMMKKTKIRVAIGAGAALAVTAGALATTAYATPSQGRGARTQLISAQVATRLTTARPLATPQSGNGDSDPRGVAVVPTSVGNLVRGDVLVSDF